MATSSITKNFVISGEEQAKKFIEAIEASAKDRPIRTPVSYREITDVEELRSLMRLRKKKMEEKAHAEG